MIGKNSLEVMEAASAEVAYARRLHREKTHESQFRLGSRGRRYCDQLQVLVGMLLNGSYPTDPDPVFIEAVRPLVSDLLRHWQIGDLDKHFKRAQ
jgi:hypothetical protein